MKFLSLARKQTKILQKIYDCQTVDCVSINDNILTAIMEYGTNDMRSVLGDVGTHLSLFSESIDIHHPDLKRIIDGGLISDDEDSFSRIAMDAMMVGSYALRENASKHVLDAIFNVVKNHPHFDWVSAQLGNPCRNHSFARLVADKKIRDFIRKTKKIQNINLSCLFGTGEEWARSPDDFDCFVRGVSIYEDDIKQAKMKLDHFRSMNLPTLSKQIEKSIENIQHKVDQNQYYGFNRIILEEACLILAKLHGFSWSQIPTQTSSSVIDRFDILVTKEVVPDYDLSTEGRFCRPRMYPYHKFHSFAPKRVKDVINFLDEYPEIGGRALFDHYQVLIPSLQIYGHCMCSEIFNLEQEHWDIKLVKKKNLLPILLGERDGEYYFICYWM